MTNHSGHYPNLIGKNIQLLLPIRLQHKAYYTSYVNPQRLINMGHSCMNECIMRRN